MHGTAERTNGARKRPHGAQPRGLLHLIEGRARRERKSDYRSKPPRSSTAAQNSPAKRGSLAAMRALVAIQPEGVPVS